jgi:hypothetical protein
MLPFSVREERMLPFSVREERMLPFSVREERKAVICGIPFAGFVYVRDMRPI